MDKPSSPFYWKNWRHQPRWVRVVQLLFLISLLYQFGIWMFKPAENHTLIDRLLSASTYIWFLILILYEAKWKKQQQNQHENA